MFIRVEVHGGEHVAFSHPSSISLMVLRGLPEDNHGEQGSDNKNE